MSNYQLDVMILDTLWLAQGLGQSTMLLFQSLALSCPLTSSSSITITINHVQHTYSTPHSFTMAICDIDGCTTSVRAKGGRCGPHRTAYGNTKESLRIAELVRVYFTRVMSTDTAYRGSKTAKTIMQRRRKQAYAVSARSPSSLARLVVSIASTRCVR